MNEKPEAPGSHQKPGFAAAQRVLVAGCGDLGTRLARQLTVEGWQVWGLRRNTDRLPPDINPLRADLGKPSSLAALPGPFDIVYYTAAADDYSEQAYQKAYVQGLGNLLAALPDVAGGRLVLVSSTSVYGQTDGSWVDESSVTEPTGFAGRILLEAERLAADVVPSCHVVRLAGIYGPGRNRLIRMAASGEARCMAGMHGNRIHVDDAAGFLAHLGQLGEPAACYVGVDDDPAPLCEVMAWLASRLGTPAPVVVEDSNDSAVTRRSNKRCCNRRLRASGHVLQYPSYRDGYGALLEATYLAR